METFEDASREADAATSAAHDLAEHGRRAIKEALHVAEGRLNDAATVAEQAFREGVEAFLNQARGYGDAAEERLSDSGRYVLARVKDRPLTAAMVGIGVGIVLGVLLSSKSK
jgi:ElaB/YqjD/DUF883 family membrane-anchored ribosome-binding protein